MTERLNNNNLWESAWKDMRVVAFTLRPWRGLDMSVVGSGGQYVKDESSIKSIWEAVFWLLE